jgi:hypothetical protein
VRYDKQINDKVAFSLQVKEQLRTQLLVLSAAARERGDTLEVPSPIFDRATALAASLAFHFAKPDGMKQDLDNLCKFALDALQSQFCDGVIWTDDRQVHIMTASKAVTGVDETLITLSVLEKKQ